MNDTGFRFEARVAPDGRIAELAGVSDCGRRSVAPFSDEGIAFLSRGRDVVYRFDDERRLGTSRTSISSRQCDERSA